MNINESAPGRRLFSVGHSNHPVETFLELLRRHRVEVLVDVRSQPYSRYAGQFDREALEEAAGRAGVKYLFLGQELGGRPLGEEFYDDQGHVLYGRVARSPAFLEGIERLQKGMEQYRVAMMCSEEDPAVCHRHRLIARVLAERGVRIDHIRGDGRVQSEEELRAAVADNQGTLFAEPEEESWRSLRPVRKGERPA